MISVKSLLGVAERQISEIISKDNAGVERVSAGNIKPPVPQFARIITGIRRCGKSTFVCQQVKKSRSAFYLNFDEPELLDFSSSDFAILDDAIKQYENSHSECTELYFDEIQVVSGWEVYVSSKLKEGYLVTVTGSNAAMLSVELGSRLTGRHLDYELFPFDFAEYSMCSTENPSFSDYLIKGGFPEFLIYGKSEILKRLFDDILLRDVVVRYKVRDISAVRTLALYLISNCANLVTGSRLSAQLGIKTTATVLEYLSFFEQCYLFSFIQRFDYSLKSRSVNPKKVYCIDTGLIGNVSVSASKDIGRMFENAVFLMIRRRSKNIWYYSEAAFECDFLFGSSNMPELAVQACYELTSENMQREVKGLVRTCKKFSLGKAYIVTMNQTDRISCDGKMIDVIPIEKFEEILS